MAGQFDPKQFLKQEPGGYNSPPSRLDIAKLVGVLLVEASMLTLMYGVFSETMGLASNVYLSELPGIGKLFGLIDEEATVSHLLAFLLAVFSVAVPIMIWSVVLDEKVHLDHQAWLANPVNRMRAIFGLSLYGAVFLLEVLNLYTLIAQQAASNPFGGVQDLDPLMAFLAQNKALGVFISILIAVVNLVLGLMTVLATHNVTRQRKG
jgi:hypothetical protein